MGKILSRMTNVEQSVPNEFDDGDAADVEAMEIGELPVVLSSPKTDNPSAPQATKRAGSSTLLTLSSKTLDMSPQLSQATEAFIAKDVAACQAFSADIDRTIERLRRGERLKEGEALMICRHVRDLLVEEPNVQSVNAPVVICGDIHGQFYDLLKLFEVGGQIPSINYLFLGDYVDRGNYSTETLLLLLAYKVRYPDRITLIRGNHESRQITSVYGFYDECLRKYGAEVYRACVDVFDYMILAAVVGGKVFGVHGGLSPKLQTIDSIRLIDRKQEVPHDGIMCDLLWSDPDEALDTEDGFGVSPRGAGYLFSERPATAFCEVNGLDYIARAHQLVMEGFREHFGRVVTIWSAPNYCYRCGNTAAIWKLDAQMNHEVLKFEQAENEQALTAMRQNARMANAQYFL